MSDTPRIVSFFAYETVGVTPAHVGSVVKTDDPAVMAALAAAEACGKITIAADGTVETNWTDGVEFRAHCDDVNCGLGTCRYTCPACLKECDDYGDGWFDRDEVYGGRPAAMACEHCAAALALVFAGGEYRVRRRAA